MYLPAIDAIQLLIRNRSLIEGKGGTRPLSANDHAILGTPPSRLVQKIGAPLARLFPGCISTLQPMAYPALNLHIAKITMQKFAIAGRYRRHSSYRFPAKSRKPNYEQETCTQHMDKDIHSIGTYLGAKSRSDFGCLSESTTHDNTARPESLMLNIAA